MPALKHINAVGFKPLAEVEIELFNVQHTLIYAIRERLRGGANFGLRISDCGFRIPQSAMGCGRQTALRGTIVTLFDGSGQLFKCLAAGESAPGAR